LILNCGAIHRINLSPTTGREQRGMARPCLIIQSQMLQNCGTAIVIPLTSQKPTARFPLTAHLPSGTGGNQIECWAKITQIRVIDESRIQPELIGQLSEEELKPIKRALKLVLNL